VDDPGAAPSATGRGSPGISATQATRRAAVAVALVSAGGRPWPSAHARLPARRRLARMSAHGRSPARRCHRQVPARSPAEVSAPLEDLRRSSQRRVSAHTRSPARQWRPQERDRPPPEVSMPAETPLHFSRRSTQLPSTPAPRPYNEKSDSRGSVCLDQHHPEEGGPSRGGGSARVGRPGAARPRPARRAQQRRLSSTAPGTNPRIPQQ
jgi:hypothetical protein